MPILTRNEKIKFQNRIYALQSGADYPERLFGLLEEVAELGRELAYEEMEESKEAAKCAKAERERKERESGDD
jgi:hypothetical protein